MGSRCGTNSAYCLGCRCDDCRRAHNAYAKSYMKASPKAREQALLRSPRYLASKREKAKQLRASDPANAREQDRLKYSQNADVKRAQARARRAADPAKFKKQYAIRRAANPNKRRDQARRRYAANLNTARDRSRKHYQSKGRAKRLAANKRWRTRNPDRIRAKRLRYEWSYRKAHGHASASEISARVAYFGGVCSYCGDKYLHIDHAIPLSRGGTNWPANLRPACDSCNLRKHTKTAAEFIAARNLESLRRGVAAVLQCA